MRTRNDPEVLRLSAEAGVDPRTAIRALDGAHVRVLAMARIEEAAKRLGIKLPKEKT